MAKRRPEEAYNWTVTKKILGELLTKHYQACTTDELPPRLREVLKKLDEEKPEPLERIAR